MHEYASLVSRGGKDPRFVLVYAPQQFRLDDSAKPEGSLGLPYLAAALERRGYEVDILDTCVGTDAHSLKSTFYRREMLENGLIRVGMADDAILKEIAPYDVVAVTSIFTAQTSRVVELVRLVKTAFPDKLVVGGGGNARWMADRFLDAGADLISLSEAEETIVSIGEVLRSGSWDFSDVPGVAFRYDGLTQRTPPRFATNLDDLAVPAWHRLPLEHYWTIARPHGAGFPPDKRIRYAPMMTSRGCPFRCEFCHISKETSDSRSGNLRQLRLKSDRRVAEECDALQALGVEYVFLEDDSLLAKKARALRIFNELRRRRLTLSSVNGVNIAHLFRRVNGAMEVDVELLEAMAEAGFREIQLPFESGCQRIIDKYATGKLDLSLDMTALIRTAKRLGIIVGGNYTFGYPDETYEELTETILLAQRHMDEGLDRANLMIIVPFPGTLLYDRAMEGGHLSPSFDVDMMNWMYPTMTGTIVHPEVLRYVTRLCWKMLNPPSRIAAVAAANVLTKESALN